MAEQDQIVNRVERMGLITIDLEELIPDEAIIEYDIKDDLWHGLALKEKDFREKVANHNWNQFKNKHVAIFCSEDAIIPTWAYMLLTSALKPFAKSISFGTKAELENELLLEAIDQLVESDYEDRRVVIKGCGDKEISIAAYVAITQKLQDHAKMIMFGEPCSTVPVYRKKA